MCKKPKTTDDLLKLINEKINPQPIVLVCGDSIPKKAWTDTKVLSFSFDFLTTQQKKIEALERKQKIDDARITADNEAWKIQNKQLAAYKDLVEKVKQDLNELNGISHGVHEHTAENHVFVHMKECIEISDRGLKAITDFEQSVGK